MKNPSLPGGGNIFSHPEHFFTLRKKGVLTRHRRRWRLKEMAANQVKNKSFLLSHEESDNSRAGAVSVEFSQCCWMCMCGFTVFAWRKAAQLRLMSLGQGGASLPQGHDVTSMVPNDSDSNQGFVIQRKKILFYYHGLMLNDLLDQTFEPRQQFPYKTTANTQWYIGSK